MTPDLCISIAKDAASNPTPTIYHYVGLEYGRECYGNTIAPASPTSLVGNQACAIPCMGNTSEICGARLMYNMWASVTSGSVFEVPVATVTAT